MRRGVLATVAVVLALSGAYWFFQKDPGDNAIKGQIVGVEPSPMTPKQIHAGVRQGVVRVEAHRCTAAAKGSGFFVAKDLVVTSAHVVDEAVTISLRADDGIARAEVIGRDSTQDVALLRVVTPQDGRQLRGTTLAWASSGPKSSEFVMAVGYPGGKAQRPATGHVTAVGAKVRLGDATSVEVLRHDAKLGTGDEGAPLLNDQGQVVGMVDMDPSQRSKGRSAALAVPAEAITSLIDGWADDPEATEPGRCSRPGVGVVSITSRHPDARGIAFTVDRYVKAFNSGNTSGIEQALTPGYFSSLDTADGFPLPTPGDRLDEVRLTSANRPADERGYPLRDAAIVSYRLIEDYSTPGPVPLCTMYETTLTLSVADGDWRIERATPKFLRFCPGKPGSPSA